MTPKTSILDQINAFSGRNLFVFPCGLVDTTLRTDTSLVVRHGVIS